MSYRTWSGKKYLAIRGQQWRSTCFARNLRIDTRIVGGASVAHSLVDFARSQNVTQIYMARARSKGRLPFLRRDTVHGVVRLARDIQVVIVSERKR
jgi:K+-sensing histidine kinase KdpD